MAHVAVDAMGGDHAPGEIVRGAAAAVAATEGLTVTLVGREDAIRAELPPDAHLDRIHVVHATDVVEMHESPVDALRRKADTSILRAVKLLADGQSDALVSAGNTGGVVAAATFALPRLPNARRAGIAVPMPTRSGTCVLMDVGANISCKPLHLVQYAVMATEYSRHVMGVPDPRVALLSVGGEEGKGNSLVLKAAAALKQWDGVQFIGNAEGQDVFKGVADVVVCEGFVGNVILKSCEGMSEVFLHHLIEELSLHIGEKDERARKVLSDFRAMTDYAQYGGAPLIGHERPVFICHGRSSARAMGNAVKAAAGYVSHRVTEHIEASLAALARSTAIAELVGGAA